jgi:hypothetical protein
MNKTEKQLRAEYEGKFAATTIDALIKAEREAGRLNEETDEDEDGDEGDYLDKQAEAIAKARQSAKDELAKAEKIKTEVYTVSEPNVGDNSPEQRPTYDRRAISDDTDIDSVDAGEIMRDIVKATTDAMNPALKKLGTQIAKAFAVIEARLASQDAILASSLNTNEALTKAMSKQAKRVGALTKALDVQPVARTPRYSVSDVQPLGNTLAGSRQTVNEDDLKDWIEAQMGQIAKSAIGRTERERMDALSNALADLDAGTTTPDSIAKAIGFPKA